MAASAPMVRPPDGTGAARVRDGAAQGRELDRQSVMVGRRSAARKPRGWRRPGPDPKLVAQSHKVRTAERLGSKPEAGAVTSLLLLATRPERPGATGSRLDSR